MMSAAFSRRWLLQPDLRELMRVELVGLASEIETVAARVDLELLGDAQAGAEQLRSRCRTHRENASAVLALEHRFEDWPEEKLVAALESFRAQQRELLQIRNEAERLIGNSPARIGRRSRTAMAHLTIQGS